MSHEEIEVEFALAGKVVRRAYERDDWTVIEFTDGSYLRIQGIHPPSAAVTIDRPLSNASVCALSSGTKATMERLADLEETYIRPQGC